MMPTKLVKSREISKSGRNHASAKSETPLRVISKTETADKMMSGVSVEKILLIAVEKN